MNDWLETVSQPEPPASSTALSVPSPVRVLVTGSTSVRDTVTETLAESDVVSVVTVSPEADGDSHSNSNTRATNTNTNTSNANTNTNTNTNPDTATPQPSPHCILTDDLDSLRGVDTHVPLESECPVLYAPPDGAEQAADESRNMAVSFDESNERDASDTSDAGKENEKSTGSSDPLTTDTDTGAPSTPTQTPPSDSASPPAPAATAEPEPEPEPELKPTEIVPHATLESRHQLEHRLQRTIQFATLTETVTAQREWYRSLLERSADLLFVLDETGEITYVSPSAEDDSSAAAPPGATADDLQTLRGSHFLDRIHPDDTDSVRAAIAAVRSADIGSTEAVEYQCRTSGETETWGVYEATLTNRLGDEPVDGIVVSVRDVTEYHRVERELDESFRRVTDAFFALDADWQFSYINEQAAATLDADKEDLLGESILDVFPEMTGTDFQQAAIDAMEEQELRSLERYYGPYDRWIEARIYPSATGVSVYFRDITDRIERERELEVRTERLQAIVNNAPLILFTLDPDGTVTLAEGQGLERLDTVPEEVVGRSVLDLFDDDPKVRSDFRAALEGYPIHVQNEVDGRILDAWCRPVTVDRDGDRNRDRDGDRNRDRNRNGDGDETENSHSHSHTRESVPGPATDEQSDIERIIGTAVDVTERVQYQETLNGLHDATSHLLTVESKQAACEYIVDVAAEVLDLDACVYRFDDQQNELVPAAYSTALESLVGPPPRLQPGECLAWETFVAGSPSIFDDVSQEEKVYDPGTDARSALFVPLGEHGVLVAVSPERNTYDDETAELAQLFARTAEAALDRIGRTRRLHERERELKQQNDRLERLNAANRVRQEIEQLLLMADSRTEIEQGICAQLTDLDACSMAWIGAPDPGGNELRVRTQAGRDHGYLDTVAVTTVDDSAAEPAGRTARTRTPTAVDNVADAVHDGDWRAEALSQTFQSVYAVPLVYDDFLYGVLALYGDDRNAFDDRLREVLVELGETIAYSIDAVKRRRAASDDDRTEVELEIERGSILGDLATHLGATVELEGATAGADETVVFVSIDGLEDEEKGDGESESENEDSGKGDNKDEAEAEAESEGDSNDNDSETMSEPLQTAKLNELPGIVDSSVIASSDGQTLLQLRIAGSFLGSIVGSQGGTLRSVSAAVGDPTRARLDVPDAVEIRDILSALDRNGIEATMIARRDQPAETPLALDAAGRSALLGQLTERQREVVQTAYYGGFFDWPRETTGEEIADSLDISSPAFHKHVRASEAKLFDTLFDDAFSTSDG
ncbi:GAF domain-containing protein [Natrialba sp. SSL1]|uniref:GAF domain-containing protein n=1 Tax=Natrialba sp. SSL1 TaxID=1869245 RepID=UPI0008F8BEA9|nr:GAF domain-containing protein [Natrialba sp. SSL1]OIB58894.1 histidine kinase [Natrialba sp. SSL1]